MLIPSGWACARSRPMWVSPRNSPVRLGVSPAASTPTGVFSPRFEALFPLAGTLGCVVCLDPQLFLLVICMQMWDCLAHQLPPRLSRSTNHHLAMSCLCPSCPSQPLLLVWMNVSSLTPWLSDFHTVRFSGSYGYFLFLNLLLSFF